MAHSFPVQFSMQLHPLQRSVFWDWSKRNISFSTASSSATSEHGNHVTKENMSFFLIQTQSRNIIRAKWGLWWDGVISINEVQKREQRDCLECLWIQFSLLPGPRWLVLHPWLYHCQHRLEGVSSQGSAFQVCCFLSPRNWLYVSALGSSSSPPETPNSATSACVQSGSVPVPSQRSENMSDKLSRNPGKSHPFSIPFL